jgi:hypothetical protein
VPRRSLPPEGKRQARGWFCSAKEGPRLGRGGKETPSRSNRTGTNAGEPPQALEKGFHPPRPDYQLAGFK